MFEDMLRTFLFTLEGIGLISYPYVSSHIIIVITRALILHHLRHNIGGPPIGLFDFKDVKPLGVEVVKDAQDKVTSIQPKFLIAQSIKKKYADHKVRDMF